MGTNTGIGIGIGIPFKNNALGGDRPYLPPELKARLIGVWDNYGKKNTDADRNIIKNKIPNAGGDLEILNSAYRLNSGFGEYKEDFTSWRIYPNIEVTDNVIITNGNFNSTWFIYKYADENEINEMNIKVSGIPEGGKILYLYIPDETATIPVSYNISKDGVYHLPKSKLSSNRVSVGFTVSSSYDWNNIRIEQLSDFGGAFVTDGVNDMIISQKTLQEMGVTKELTIVSMIHQISYRGSASVPLTNYIRRPKTSEYVRNHVSNIGKTGIYGYVCYDISNSNAGNSHVVNTILGDKNDYSINIFGNLSQGKFSVQGYIDGNGNILETSSVAHYWTFAVLGKATEDDINLIIGYFDLDRTLKADIYYNIERQGITNDNHAEFNDKLIDYSGNGRDLQLFNIGWNLGSGIGKYVTNFGIWSKDAESNISYNSYSFTVNGSLKRTWLMWYVTELPSFKIKVSGINSNGYVDYGYYDNGSLKNFRLDKDGIHTLPPSGASSNGHGFKVNDTSLDWTGLVIEQIPDFAGALCFDGVDDYGQFVGDLGLKDYTVAADRAYVQLLAYQVPLISEINSSGITPFIFEYVDSNKVNPFSFGDISKTNDIVLNRKVSYQSTYVYNGLNITKGTATDTGRGITIGRYGEDRQYANIVLWSFLLFPYSLSEFLLERQLKKHKLGTLYPGMVEFRPIIKSNIDILKINYWDKDLNVVKAGDYISIGSNIKTSITVLDGYKISKVSSAAFNNITIEKSNTDFIYDVIFYGIKKSPQKINLVIEQDSDYVQWNPNIKANVSKYSVTANIRETDGTTLKLVNGQFYSTSITGNLILDIVPPYEDSDEVTNVVIDGKSYVPTKDSSGNYYRLEIPLVFPKEINITIQEYVRYEDIVQPYPVLLRFKDENNNEISWGDKIKLGSSITRIGSFNDCNLLKDIYTVSNAKLNGNPLTSTPHVVERQMVFTCTATWIFDDNEPNCILSPRLLRIPNSSYKILRHIPDISGHGNHGVIYNSAYAKGSGINGYVENFNDWRISKSPVKIEKTDSQVRISHIGTSYKTLPIFEYTNPKVIQDYTLTVEITGIPNDCIGKFIYFNTYTQEVTNGINTIKFENNSKWFGFTFYREDNSIIGDCDITIKQIGEYEGAYCLDGINDFVTIPTLSKGGKQVLMKVNWSTLNGFIYDQRPSSGDKTFGIYTQGDVIAYSQHNNGNTYIDGIVNNNIIGSNLSKITHNIVATCDVDNSIVPSIGKCSYSNNYFAQMALFDFMLFDEISTEDNIKRLNKYVGIEAKVEIPNYYWDNYGKKNTDARRGYIDEQVSLQKTGTSVNPLENFNIGYEGMSGYNGYPVVLGANKTWETSNAVDYIYDINSTIVHITNVKHAANGLLYSYVKRDEALANIKEIPAFRVTVKGLEENSKLIYKYLATENATKESIVYLGNGIHKLPKSFVPTDALLDLTTNSWIGFAITPMIEGELVFDCDITIEILPEYENGLVYDGVSDFTDNKNIPIFTDFTAIIKRVDLDAKNDNSTVMFKGNKIYESSIGNGFILDYCYNSKNHVYSYGKLNQIERDDSKIIYLTPESYNGNPIIKGENEDNLGLVLGKYWKGIIYKTILYSKTISLLEINFLKNLMEKDEIIDINHPIFISNTEDESNASQDT